MRIKKYIRDNPLFYIKVKKDLDGLKCGRRYPVYRIETKELEAFKREVDYRKYKGSIDLDDYDYDKIEEEAENEELISDIIVWFFIGDKVNRDFKWVDSNNTIYVGN